MPEQNDPATNFGEAATRYTSFRPSYPPEIFDFLVQHITSGRSHAIDLGAGSGQATLALSKIFERVTAVESDARLAGEACWPENTDVEIKSAEAVEFGGGQIDAIISATAFHWMDQRTICEKALRWLKSGGAFFPFAYDVFDVDGTARDFYRAEFEKWASVRDQRLVDCYDYQRVLANCGVFETVIPYAQTIRHVLTPECAAGLISTFSFARDYARANGFGDEYFSAIKDEFSRVGETVEFIIPIKGALGLKG